MKIKRGEVKVLFATIQKLLNSTEKTNSKFAYALAKNKSRLREEIESLQEAEKPIAEFENKRVELCKQYALKNKDGNPVLEDNVYKGVAESFEFQQKFESLKEKYELPLSQMEKLYTEEVEVDFYLIDKAELPEIIIPAEVDILFPLIKDSEEEKSQIEKLKGEIVELKKKIAELGK